MRFRINDGRPTMGFDVDQLILVGDGDSYLKIQAVKKILQGILDDLDGKRDAWYVGKDQGIRSALSLLDTPIVELRQRYPEHFSQKRGGG